MFLNFYEIDSRRPRSTFSLERGDRGSEFVGLFRGKSEAAAEANRGTQDGESSTEEQVQVKLISYY